MLTPAAMLIEEGLRRLNLKSDSVQKQLHEFRGLVERGDQLASLAPLYLRGLTDLEIGYLVGLSTLDAADAYARGCRAARRPGA